MSAALPGSPTAIVAGFLEVWEQLPQLSGRGWLDVSRRLDRALQRVVAAETEAALIAALGDALHALRDLPACRRQLGVAIRAAERNPRLITRHDTERHGDRQARAQWRSMQASLGARLAPTMIARSIEVLMPESLAVGHRGGVVVTLRHPSARPCAPRVALHAELDVLLSLHAESPGIRVIGDNLHEVALPARDDSKNVGFVLEALATGPQELRLDLRQGGAVIATLPLHVAVDAQAGAAREQRTSMDVELHAVPPPGPDLELRVKVRRSEHGGTEWESTLHSTRRELGFFLRSFSLWRQPETMENWHTMLMRRVEEIAAQSGLDQETTSSLEEDLRGVGRKVYEEIFPADLRAAFRGLPDDVRSLRIVSDEPWIPWQLVCAYDDDDPHRPYSAPFFGERFELTHWLPGNPPPPRIQVPSLAFVPALPPPSPTCEALPHVEEERGLLASFLAAGASDVSPAPVTRAAVLALIRRGGVGLWHFAGHGGFDAQEPEGARLGLSDGSKLRADDLHGPRRSTMKRDQPLVFINACRSSRQGWALSGLGGWASALIKHGACGAFIGAMWQVGDDLAYEFARVFYDGLARGCSLGAATQQASVEVRQLFPGDPGWLAYTCYSDPDAVVSITEHTTPTCEPGVDDGS